MPNRTVNDRGKSSTLFKFGFSALLIMTIVFLMNGCARWPDGGGGEENKLLIIRVDLNENGQLNTELGKYYIVFDTKEEASKPPSWDREEWEGGYYYIMLDYMGFCFGKWDSTCLHTSIGVTDDNYFQVNLDLDSLGNPEKIFMNVITTDYNDTTYDYINNSSDLTIDTSLSNFNKIVQDFPLDSDGGLDFDIIKVTISLVMS
ncbi:MAG: hypothetical protein PHI72_07925 [Atribacterota bacterium]|nr:hypothetical protein [Atribacterota bacterium]MDD4896150.1 hypothetical protein [Atribacterota bacterium]MDD5638026.1 hypothetical protein [Atribacterota bacterium]